MASQHFCNICNRLFATKTGLSAHNREIHNAAYEAKRLARKPFKCPDCKYRYETQELMEKHRATHDGFFCDVCGQKFTQKGSLTSHIRRHRGIKEFKCNYENCNYAGFTKRELKSHYMCHTGIMPRVCELCGKQCRDGTKLKEHMYRHTGER